MRHYGAAPHVGRFHTPLAATKLPNSVKVKPFRDLQFTPCCLLTVILPLDVVLNHAKHLYESSIEIVVQRLGEAICYYFCA